MISTADGKMSIIAIAAVVVLGVIAFACLGFFRH